MAEWLKAVDCKSIVKNIVGSNPTLPTYPLGGMVDTTDSNSVNYQFKSGSGYSFYCIIILLKFIR